MHLRQLELILIAVERTLRQQFPNDFFKRCAYSAFGIRALMKDAGVCAELVGGDFAAFTMSPSGDRAAVQGFGFGDDQCAHFWVEADQRLVDIAPYFLPHDSSYPRKSSYAPKASRSGGCQGGNGRVIFATT
jgi:hypothetical protein